MVDHSFNGKWFYKDFDVVAKTVRPFSPPQKTATISMGSMDGQWDFSEIYGRPLYDKKPLQVSISIPANSSRELLWYKKRRLAAWLNVGKRKFISSDEPDKYEIVKLTNPEAIEDLGMVSKCDLMFECEPYSTFVASTPITLDSGVPMSSVSDLRLDDQFEFAITNPQTISVHNFGTAYIMPRIEVEGAFTDITISYNGTAFHYLGPVSNGNLIIDDFRVTLNGINAINNSNANFFELLPGDCDISIGGTWLNCTIRFIFAPQYL